MPHSVTAVSLPQRLHDLGTQPQHNCHLCPWNHQAQHYINTLRPRQNGHHLADDIFKRIFLNENVRISIKISLKFVPKGPINNIPALVQIMAWCRSGDKPLSEPMTVVVPTHICVTRPQWVNKLRPEQNGGHLTDRIFKQIFLKQKFCILVSISQYFVLGVPIDNKSTLVNGLALSR